MEASASAMASASAVMELASASAMEVASASAVDNKIRHLFQPFIVWVGL